MWQWQSPFVAIKSKSLIFRLDSLNYNRWYARVFIRWLWLSAVVVALFTFRRIHKTDKHLRNLRAVIDNAIDLTHGNIFYALYLMRACVCVCAIGMKHSSTFSGNERSLSNIEISSTHHYTIKTLHPRLKHWWLTRNIRATPFCHSTSF